MIIICEGLDKTGKSTLVDFIAQEFQLPVYHPSKIDGSVPIPIYTRRIEGEYFAVARMVNEFDLALICDRFHFSQYVYPKVYGNYDEYMEQMFEEVEKLLKGKAMIIYCHGDIDVILSRIEKIENDKILIRNKLQNYFNFYEEAILKSKLPLVKIDSSKNSINEARLIAKKAILDFIQ